MHGWSFQLGPYADVLPPFPWWCVYATQAEMILIPEIVNDIVNHKPHSESWGIAKYLFRPQVG